MAAPRMAVRSAFTLIELLVVITIIGILMSLLLPAVQQIREAARRLQCGNNLKQIGLALHNYENTHRKFPPGWISQGGNRGVTEPEWGWPAFILPYVEQTALYDRLGVNERRLFDVIASNDRVLVQQRIDIYRCPSDATPDILPREMRLFDSRARSRFQPATSNYIGANGLFDRGADFRNNGIFYGNSATTIAAVKDGTSNTFMVGERDERCASGNWCGARNPPHTGMWGSYQVRARVSMKFNDPTNGRHDTCTEGFSSAHPGGGSFVFADGSVHFVSENIQFNNGGLSNGQLGGGRQPNRELLGLYQRLGIRNDGMPLQGEY